MFNSLLNAQPDDYQYSCGSSGGSSNTSSKASENPICTDPNAIKNIRVAVHYILPESPRIFTVTDNCTTPTQTFSYLGWGNFTETHDGFGDENVLTVFYDLPDDGVISLSLVHLSTGQVNTLASNEPVISGNHQRQFSLPLLPAGTHALQAIYNAHSYSIHIVKM